MGNTYTNPDHNKVKLTDKNKKNSWLIMMTINKEIITKTFIIIIL